MTPEEAIQYIENYSWSSTKLGLERERELLQRLGNPQKELKFVHVAGSNGKGSTCAMLESVLRSAGFKTGLYTSPYIQEFGERIQVCGRNISGEELAQFTQLVKLEAESMEDHPSQFEMVTALAMLYFRSIQCDIVVLEVGMGGALDATNAIDAPEVAVLTNIGLEHTEYLGDTIEKIALHKAGIIKPGCSAVCYDGDPAVSAVGGRVCEELKVSLRYADFSKLEAEGCTLDGQSFRYRGEEYEIALLGGHQLKNAAVVLETVAALRERGWVISDSSVHEGLRSARWPARLEVLSRAPLFILDGGHNPQCAEALAESLDKLIPGQKAVVLMGVLGDKDYRAILNTVMPYASKFVCVAPLSARAMKAEQLAEIISSAGAPAVSCESIGDGIRTALETAGESGTVIAFGSLYMAGEVRNLFTGTLKSWLRRKKIRSRNSLDTADRLSLSRAAEEKVIESPEFIQAKTIMLYSPVKAETDTQGIAAAALAAGKRVVYPLCLDNFEMAILEPLGEESWKEGYKGIREPVPEKSRLVYPEEIDLIICPCSSFDAERRRLGMGAGFYDRFLPKCEHAVKAALAFEVQKAKEVPHCETDFPMDIVFTDSAEYRA